MIYIKREAPLNLRAFNMVLIDIYKVFIQFILDFRKKRKNPKIIKNAFWTRPDGAGISRSRPDQARPVQYSLH